MHVRLVFLLVIALAVPAAARAQMISVQGVVIEETPVRIVPTATVPLTTLRRGTDITVVSVEGSWLQIAFEDLRYGTRVGYVPGSTVRYARPGVPAATRTVPPASPPAPSRAPSPAPPAPVDGQPAALIAAAAPPAAAVPAPRPPVRLVEAHFPAPVATSAAATTAAPSVISLGNAFPDATGSPSAPADAAVLSLSASALPAPVTSASAPAAPAVRLDARGPQAIRPPVSPKRGMPVTLMIPRALLQVDGDRTSRRSPAFAADITAAGRDGAAVNGVTDWLRAGLPSLLEGTIGKITRKKDHTAVEVRTTGAQGVDTVVTLRFAHTVPEPEAVLGQLLVEGAADTLAAQAYRREAHAAVAEAVFAGAREEVPEERRLSILATLQAATGAPDVHLHEGQVYASFDYGVDERVFYDRSADVETIVAHVLRDTVLPELRTLATALAALPELRGMRVVYRIPHSAKPRAPVQEYRLELLADMAHVLNLVGAASTEQEFLDASSLLVDGDPVRPALEPPASATN